MRQLGSILDFKRQEEFLANLEEWQCPMCGSDVAAPKDRQPAERRCMTCIQANILRPLGSRGSREGGLRDAGVPLRYQAPFQERRWPSFQGVCSKDWTGSPWACGFVGESRSGKTFLATELFWRQIASTTTTALWAAADELVDSGFSQGADKGLFAQAKDVKLLLIDDLGWGGGLEKLFGLLRARHAAMRPTIWTANVTMTELAKSTAGQALVARLKDDGWVFGLTGKWQANP